MNKRKAFNLTQYKWQQIFLSSYFGCALKKLAQCQQQAAERIDSALASLSWVLPAARVAP